MIFNLPPLRDIAAYVVDATLLILAYIGIRYLMPKAATKRPVETALGVLAVLFAVTVLFLPFTDVLAAGAALTLATAAYILGVRKSREKRRARHDKE